MVVGIADSWDNITSLCSAPGSGTYTWLPCGRFVAAFVNSRVQIWDALSSELVSTLAGFGGVIGCGLTYSPDGRALACLSDTLRIWDIQTGGAAKEVRYDRCYNGSIVWSLDSKAIGITKGPNVHVYDVASGTTQTPGVSQLHSEAYLWAHDRSFRVMTRGPGSLEIFEVGPDLTKIESFRIGSGECIPNIGAFSPKTYRVSTSDHIHLRILDVRDAKCLLTDGKFSPFHCFSPNGSLFAASLLEGGVRVWRYASGRYTLWRIFPNWGWPTMPPLQFSPTTSSILRRSGSLIQVYHLDAPPVDTRTAGSVPLTVLSPCGRYFATARQGGHTVTITNLLSQTASQFVNAGEIGSLAITGNVLLVFLNGREITAWRLTEAGRVDGVFGDRRLDGGDSIWTISACRYPMFGVKVQAVVIYAEGEPIHVYHAGTGEVLTPDQTPPGGHLYTFADLSLCRHYPHYRKAHEPALPCEDGRPVPLVAPQAEWVRDPEGEHRLWIPVEWRVYNWPDVGWLCDTMTLWLKGSHGDIVIMF